LGDFIAFSTITISILYLVYSLAWKDIEKNLNLFDGGRFISNKLVLLNVFGFLVGGLSSYFSVNVMYVIIVLFLGYASFLSYINYIENKKKNSKNKFPQLYFIVLFLSFLVSLGHFLIFFIPFIKYYVYFITIAIFLVFLYGVIFSKGKIS
jgi:hypothetical protein